MMMMLMMMMMMVIPCLLSKVRTGDPTAQWRSIICHSNEVPKHITINLLAPELFFLI
jgi:hypothetical protein